MFLYAILYLFSWCLLGIFSVIWICLDKRVPKKTENHCHVLFKVVICGFNSLPDKPTITFGGLHQLTITSHEYPNLLWYQPIFGWRWPKPSISVQTIQGFPKVYLEKWDTCVLYNYIWYIIYIYTCIYIYIMGFHKWWYPSSWLVYFRENPKIKWMRTGGTPILGNLHIHIYIYPLVI